MPIGDLLPLFDHLVSAGDESGRHGETERPCGLEVDGQHVLGGGLNRQFGGFLALKDAVDVGGGAASMAYLVRPI